MRVILDDKYEKADLNKDTKNQCQYLTETQHNELMKSLQKSEELFYGTLGTWKTHLLDFELEEGAKLICSIPYPVPMLHE